MVTYDEVINTFIKLGLSELDGEVICFADLGLKIMDCELPLKYELQVIDKRFIFENWDRILKTYEWVLSDQERELNPCKEMEGYQLIMWMFRKGVNEKLRESKFYNQNKRNNIYMNNYVINRLLEDLGIAEKENKLECLMEYER